MADAPRISAEEARERVKSGGALLICAYDSDDKFRANNLDGSISFSEFMERLSTLPPEQELIFY